MTKPLPQPVSDPFAAFGDPVPQPLSYHVVVRPLPPKKQTSGGIVLAEVTRNADLQTKTVGEVLAIGDLAWKARTEGLDFGDDRAARSIKVGDLVVFRQHAGQRVNLRVSAAEEKMSEFAGDEAPKRYLLIMADTDIIAKLDRDQVAKIYDWV